METLKSGHISEIERLTQTMNNRLMSQKEESENLLDDLRAQHESYKA
jgi:hypothetical protein